MEPIVRVSVRLTRGISQRVNPRSIIDFSIEVLQEIASQVWDRPEDLLLLLLVIPTVAIAFIAKATIPAIWNRIRNPHKTEVNSPQEANRG